LRTIERLSIGSVLAIAAGGCMEPPTPADAGGSNAGNLVVSKVIDANFPIAVAFAPDGRIFFTEKVTGQVRIIKDGVLLSQPFTKVSVNSLNERGLLGIALHPNFASNGWAYVFYTRARGAGLGAESNRVARFTASGDVAIGAEKMIIDLPVSAATSHNGGNIRFGPDGKLYVTIGELNDPFAALDLTKLQGKILRLNDDGSTPTDNPMPGSLVYAYGLRNSFDFSFDPMSGDVIASENGANADDEINHIVPGGNYGWPEIGGVVDPDEAAYAASVPNFHEPLLTITPTTAPTGIDFAPNDLLGKANLVYFGEYKTGRIWSVELDDARDAVVSQSEFATGFSGGITDVAFAPDGTMYVLTSTAIWHVTPSG
jgi:glucose/arabinose dehydrogenase